MKKLTLPIIIILIIILTIGTYTILNTHQNTNPQYSHGLQTQNIIFTQDTTNYQIQITLSPEQIKQGINQINIEFYGNNSILYRDTINEINGNTITYELPKDIIRENLKSILITSFNQQGQEIGTTYKEI